MGYAEVPLDPPENFLKIGAGIRPSPAPKDHDCFRRLMPPIPKRDPSRCQSAPAKNFKLENIRYVVHAKPRQPSARYVDTRKGDSHDLNSSGLHTTFVFQPTYGKLPKYLQRRKHEMQLEDELARSEEIKRQPVCRFITRDERNELLRVIFWLNTAENPTYVIVTFVHCAGFKI